MGAWPRAHVNVGCRQSGEVWERRLTPDHGEIAEWIRALPFLRGWAGCFRYGNSSHAFDQIRRYALMRLALFFAKRHQRRARMGIRPDLSIR
jgi:hypothetical protein